MRSVVQVRRRCGVLLAAALAPGIAAAAVPMLPVALSGEPTSPGGAERFSAFGIWPTLNDAGTIAFPGTFTGPGVSADNNEGLWLVGPGGTPARILREGDTVPGGAGGGGVAPVTFGPVILAPVNNAGHVAAVTDVRSSDSSLAGRGLFRYTTGAATPLSTVARRGLAAPGTTGESFGNIEFEFGFSDLGQVAFAGGTSQRDGVWTDSPPGGPGPAGLRAVALGGQDAPATSLRYRNSFFWTEANRAGQVLYTATLTSGTGPGGPNSGKGLFIADPAGVVSKIAAVGDPAPGPGTTIGDGIGHSTFNAAGHVLFDATLGGNATSANDAAYLLRRPNGALTIAAREGQPAPVLPGVGPRNFGAGSFFGAVNREGEFAFTENRGLWTGDADDAGGANGSPPLTPVAHVGAQAPGLPAGVTFSQLGSPVINNLGEFTTFVTLAGSGVGDANNSAVYLYDPGNGFLPIVREGDRIEVGPNDFRTVAGGGIFGGGRDSSESGFARSFTDAGFVFGLRFTDGTSGVFTNVPVPEPGAVAVALAVAAVTFPRRRRPWSACTADRGGVVRSGGRGR